MYRSKFSHSSKLRKPVIFNPHSSGFVKNDRMQAAFIDPGTVSCALRIVNFIRSENRVEVIYFGVINFGKTVPEVLIGVEREFGPLLPLFETCHYIVIEKQPLIRESVYRTFQHLISFLSNGIKNRGVNGIIVEVDPKLKTCWIGGPATKKQNAGVSIKKWAKTKCIEILEEREDEFSLHVLERSYYKAKEDLSDVVCYEYAWWSYLLDRDDIPKCY